MPQRVLITGASGFVGGWLARECEESGAEVLGVSRSGASPAGTGLAVDLLDSAAVAGAVEEFRPQAIHHLAALASTGRSWQDPVRCVGDNQAMMLRNHGLMATGRSVPEAFLRLYRLERACQIQVDAAAAGVLGTRALQVHMHPGRRGAIGGRIRPAAAVQQIRPRAALKLIIAAQAVQHVIKG